MILPSHWDSKAKPGHQLKGTFMGATRFEHGLGRLGVELVEDHIQQVCTTRGGKAITQQYMDLAFHPGSAFVASMKCDLIDAMAGRRTDVTLFDDPVFERNGVHLGLNPTGITAARFHQPRGRCFNFAVGNQSVYPVNRHTLLSDVEIDKPGAWGRLRAIFGASFEREQGTKTDPWFKNGPTNFLSCGGGFLLANVPHPDRLTFKDVYLWMMGAPPKDGKADPQLMRRRIELIHGSDALGGQLRVSAQSLLDMHEKSWSIILSECETRCGWFLDDRFTPTLTGPSEFSYGRDFGLDGWPVTVFVTGIEGDPDAEAFLRAHIRLMLLKQRERDWVPEERTMLMLDELAQYAGQVEEIYKLLPIAASRKLFANYLWQSIEQVYDTIGERRANDVFANSCVTVAGVNDSVTTGWVREKLGKTTIKQLSRGWRGEAQSREVDLASGDAIASMLRMNSPLRFVFSRSRAPMCLERLAMKPLVTKEKGVFDGVPGMEGHFDELSRDILRKRREA